MSSRGYVASPLVRAAALATLTAQNAAQALLVRLSRELRPAGAAPYLGSTVVLVCELVKLAAAASLMRRGPSSAAAPRASLHAALLFAPPAAVYALQNNLLIAAARVLDPPTFLVLSQAKILTTAAFSVALLGRRLHRVRWAALTLLLTGVALVQHAHGPAHEDGPATPSSVSASEYSAGVASVLLLSTCSGFAAVYTEACLKRLRVDTQECNALMAAWGALFSAAGCLMADAGRVAAGGFFQGWSPIVGAVVAVNALGGLLVAFFLRYLDAILKNFAATASIVVSSAASVPLFGFKPSLEWGLGSLVVTIAIALYGEKDVVDPPATHAPRLIAWMGAADGGKYAEPAGADRAAFTRHQV